jgi:hypothetical protein
MHTHARMRTHTHTHTNTHTRYWLRRGLGEKVESGLETRNNAWAILLLCIIMCFFMFFNMMLLPEGFFLHLLSGTTIFITFVFHIYSRVNIRPVEAAEGRMAHYWTNGMASIWCHWTHSAPAVTTSPSSPIKVPPTSCVFTTILHVAANINDIVNYTEQMQFESCEDSFHWIWKAWQSYDGNCSSVGCIQPGGGVPNIRNTTEESLEMAHRKEWP